MADLPKERVRPGLSSCERLFILSFRIGQCKQELQSFFFVWAHSWHSFWSMAPPSQSVHRPDAEVSGKFIGGPSRAVGAFCAIWRQLKPDRMVWSDVEPPYGRRSRTSPCARNAGRLPLSGHRRGMDTRGA